MTKIYALYDAGDIIRYIGRSDDPVNRLRDHWNECDLTKTWWQPKNLWLRSLPSCPSMSVIATVRSKAGWQEDIPFIIEARKAWPGQLTNIYPVPIPKTELDLFQHLASNDDPYFDWLSFHKEKMDRSAAIASESMSSRMASRWANDPEFRARMIAGLTERNKMTAGPRMKALQADPEFQAKLAAGRKAQWNDPDRVARHAEHNRRIAAARRLSQAELAARETERARKAAERELARQVRLASKIPPMPQAERQRLARAALAEYWTPERREDARIAEINRIAG